MAASNGASAPDVSLVLQQTLEGSKTGHTRREQADTSIQIWILLQTYEGGMGGEPGNEAHGGYAFCAVAALALIGRAGELDLRRLVHWAAHRQVGHQASTLSLSPSLPAVCCCAAWGLLLPG